MSSRLMAVLALTAFSLVPLQARAHGDQPHLMGTVKEVDRQHVVVTTQEGKRVTVALSKDTKYFKGDAAGTFDDLKPGVRVVLHLDAPGANPTAVEVQIGEPKAASKH